MGLANRIEEFQSMINALSATLELINSKANSVLEFHGGEYRELFPSLCNELEEAQAQLNIAIEEMDSIRNEWG
jgi:prefoldin subunit 5